MNKHPPKLYLFIYEKLVVKVACHSYDGVVDRQEVKSFLARVLHIPKPVGKIVIKEMSEMGLIKEIDKFKIKVH